MVEGKGFVWRGPRRLTQMHVSEWTSRSLPCPTVPTSRTRRNPAQPGRLEGRRGHCLGRGLATDRGS